MYVALHGKWQRKVVNHLPSTDCSSWCPVSWDGQKASVRVIEEVFVFSSCSQWHRNEEPTPALSITELTRSRLLHKCNPRLSFCPSDSHVEEITNKHTWIQWGFTRWSICAKECWVFVHEKQDWLYGYTIMPGRVHLWMHKGNVFKAGIHFSERKVCSCKTEWLTPWKDIRWSVPVLLSYTLFFFFFYFVKLP